MVAAGIDDIQRLLMLGRELGVSFHELGKPEDGIQGGTQFVAHVGQKLAFSTTGCLCRLFCAVQFRRRFLPFDGNARQVGRRTQHPPIVTGGGFGMVEGQGKGAQYVTLGAHNRH